MKIKFDFTQRAVSKRAPEPCRREDFYRVLNEPRTEEVCQFIRRMKEGSVLPYNEIKNHFVEPKEVADREQWWNAETTSEHDRICAMKRALPAFTFLATFDGKTRNAENAHSSGLAFLDLDHINAPAEVWKQVSQKAIDAGCCLAHVTPSTEGLRMVFERPQGLSVPDAIAWFAQQIGMQKYDTGVTDLSRLSFAVPQSYLLYINEQALFEPKDFEEPQFEEAEAEELPTTTAIATKEQIEALEAEEKALGQAVMNGGYPTHYNGFRYADIIRELLEDQGYTLVDGKPTMGDRHNALKFVAPKLRHICDFDARFMQAVLPDWGLPQDEVRSLCQSAVKFEKGHSTFPRCLSNVLTRLETEKQRQESLDIFDDEEDDMLPMPAKMPKSVQRIIKVFPPAFRPAALISILPSLATLATRVRAIYYDDMVQPLTAFACIVSPQAGGKTFIKRLNDLLLAPIQMYDELEEAKLRKYEEELAKARNTKKQPEDPHPCLRLIPEKTSNTSLSFLLDNAKGQHLMLITPEIDSLAKNNKAVWSDMDDILRKAYDGDKIGQYYMSKESHKSRAQAHINVTMTGTHYAMRRYFSNIEGGLVSRVSFAQLPDTYAKNVQKMSKYTDRDLEAINATINLLMREGESEEYANECGAEYKPTLKTILNENGRPERVTDDEKVPTVVYDLPRLKKAMSNWQDDRVAECQKVYNQALDTFRRRAAVIGFRAGVLFYIMEGHKMTNEIIALSKWIADYVLDQQMRLFGGDLNLAFERNAKQAKASDAHIVRNKQQIFDQLPDRFTFEELTKLCQSQGESTKATTLRSNISRWKKFGLVASDGTNVWVKTAAATNKNVENATVVA